MRQGRKPITSSHIESTIIQINRRVKGSEKFGSGAGAGAILQLPPFSHACCGQRAQRLLTAKRTWRKMALR